MNESSERKRTNTHTNERRVGRGRVVFIHVPKTGGTSVKWHLPGMHYAVKHRTDTTYRARKGDRTIAFHRCPYDRALSLYYFFKTAPLNFLRKDQWHHRLTQSFIHSFAPTSDEFWRRVDLPLLSTVAGMPHFLPQAHWANLPATRLYDFSRFDESVDAVASDYQLDKEELPADPNNHIRKKTQHGTAGEELGEQSLEKIRNFYAADFVVRKQLGFPTCLDS